MNGTITCQFTVWCNNCTKWEQVSAGCLRSAEVEFQKDGWAKIKEHWYCKDCTNKHFKLHFNDLETDGLIKNYDLKQ